MRKKKIISLVLIILIIILGIKIYYVYSNKSEVGNSQLRYLNENENGMDEAVYKVGNLNLIKINIDSLSGVEVKDNNNVISIDTTTIEGLKGCKSFKEEQSKGKLTVKILQRNLKVIDSFTVNAGEKVSKTFLLKTGENYNVRVSSEGFRGMYKLTGNNYSVF